VERSDSHSFIKQREEGKKKKRGEECGRRPHFPCTLALLLLPSLPFPFPLNESRFAPLTQNQKEMKKKRRERKRECASEHRNSATTAVNSQRKRRRKDRIKS